MIKLMLITDNPQFAIRAENCGVDRIFLDLEYINKAERQKGRNTYITRNSVEDVTPLRNVIKKSELLVRVNPINSGSKMEIDEICRRGADIIMLPMVYDADEVKRFTELVDGRAKTMPMIETAAAFARLDDILEVEGVDEIFVGLNDLHISFKLNFMFEPLADGLIDIVSSKCKAANIPFGFGGLAKIGEGMLPAEYILGEHYRLASSSVILSRTFRNETGTGDASPVNLEEEIAKIRRQEKIISGWDKSQYEENRLRVKNIVKDIVGRA